MLTIHVANLTAAAFAPWFVPALAVAIVAASMCAVTLWLMTLAAAKEAGRAYALSHLLLAIALAPVFLIGPIVIPFLVWSDLTNRRRADARDQVR